MDAVVPHWDGGLKEQLGEVCIGNTDSGCATAREVYLTGLSLNLASPSMHFSVKKKV